VQRIRKLQGNALARERGRVKKLAELQRSADLSFEDRAAKFSRFRSAVEEKISVARVRFFVVFCFDLSALSMAIPDQNLLLSICNNSTGGARSFD
jgi:hypothetical protein